MLLNAIAASNWIAVASWLRSGLRASASLCGAFQLGNTLVAFHSKVRFIVHNYQVSPPLRLIQSRLSDQLVEGEGRKTANNHLKRFRRIVPSTVMLADVDTPD